MREKNKQKILKKNVYGIETDYDKLTASSLEETQKINELTRECNLLKDLINKIEQNKKEQIEEFYKRTKQKETNLNMVSFLRKKINDLSSNINSLREEEEKFLKEITLLANKFNFYEDEIKMKDSIIKDFKMKNMEL